MYAFIFSLRVVYAGVALGLHLVVLELDLYQCLMPYISYGLEEVASEILVFILRSGVIEGRAKIYKWQDTKKIRKLSENFNIRLACVIATII
jgi:hypothetical protein